MRHVVGQRCPVLRSPGVLADSPPSRAVCVQLSGRGKSMRPDTQMSYQACGADPMEAEEKAVRFSRLKKHMGQNL